MLVLVKESWAADLARAALTDFAKEKLRPLLENLALGRGRIPEVQTDEEFKRLVAEVPFFEFNGRYYRIMLQHKSMRPLRIDDEEVKELFGPHLKHARTGKLFKAPKFPEGGLSIANKICASVAVTRHAWQRFCVRVPPKFVMDESVEYFADLLRTAFGRATPEKLKRGGEVRRTINNKFVPAHYFYDAATNMRFVISEDEPKTVITIEQRLI